MSGNATMTRRAPTGSHTKNPFQAIDGCTGTEIPVVLAVGIFWLATAHFSLQIRFHPSLYSLGWWHKCAISMSACAEMHELVQRTYIYGHILRQVPHQRRPAQWRAVPHSPSSFPHPSPPCSEMENNHVLLVLR